MSTTQDDFVIKKDGTTSLYHSCFTRVKHVLEGTVDICCCCCDPVWMDRFRTKARVETYKFLERSSYEINFLYNFAIFCVMMMVIFACDKLHHSTYWLEVIRIALCLFLAAEFAIRLACIGVNPKFRGLHGKVHYMSAWIPLNDVVVLLASFVLCFMPHCDTGQIEFLLLLRVIRFDAQLIASKSILRAVILHRFELLISYVLSIFACLMLGYFVYLAEFWYGAPTFACLSEANWWALITMLTVGYGDYTIISPLGRFVTGSLGVLSVWLYGCTGTLIGVGLTLMIQDRETNKQMYKQRILASKFIQNLFRVHLIESKYDQFELYSQVMAGRLRNYDVFGHLASTSRRGSLASLGKARPPAGTESTNMMLNAAALLAMANLNVTVTRKDETEPPTSSSLSSLKIPAAEQSSSRSPNLYRKQLQTDAPSPFGSKSRLSTSTKRRLTAVKESQYDSTATSMGSVEQSVGKKQPPSRGRPRSISLGPMRETQPEPAVVILDRYQSAPDFHRTGRIRASTRSRTRRSASVDEVNPNTRRVCVTNQRKYRHALLFIHRLKLLKCRHKFQSVCAAFSYSDASDRVEESDAKQLNKLRQVNQQLDRLTGANYKHEVSISDRLERLETKTDAIEARATQICDVVQNVIRMLEARGAQADEKSVLPIKIGAEDEENEEKLVVNDGEARADNGISLNSPANDAPKPASTVVELPTIVEQ